MDQPVDKSLIKKFMAGECSAAEKFAVNRFLEYPEGEALFNEVLQQQWEDAANFEVGAESLNEWEKELKKTLGIKDEKKNNTAFRYIGNYLSRYAAIWIVALIAIGAYAVYSTKNKQRHEQKLMVVMDEKINPYGQRSSFLLSDSTKIYLGAGSKLSYPRTFTGGQRIVRLVGEAYFEVKRNPKKPFIIYTGKIRTMVLGTSFKINAFAGKPLSVAVATGKVRVDKLNTDHSLKSLAILAPGYQLTYNKGHAVTTPVLVYDTQIWKKGLLVFKGASLRQLTEEIGRWYNVSISIKRQSLNNIPIDVTLDANVPINKLLDGLCIIGNLRYKIVGKNKIVVY
ncbi:FecR family protein [Pedobacter psychrodurus]|uniref:FecR family protein n=1 Tax=Pedobacter psychrodurus TaxID=2530456 RepID=UPI0029315B36|nr:FecR domain-containing protein [Pedobacter psychrodurus]